MKSEQKVSDTACEVREGDTYQTNIGQEKSIPDTAEIPKEHDITQVVVSGVSDVMFDLETGGLARTSDILQISAVCGNKEFNYYVTPTQPITKGSSKVTKLTVVNDQMCFDGKAVETIGINNVLSKFVGFLTDIEKPVLVGHNIKTFDLMFLHSYLIQNDYYEPFVSTVVGFVDTSSFQEGISKTSIIQAGSFGKGTLTCFLFST